jgi:DNA-binding NtrC family response regulator
VRTRVLLVDDEAAYAEALQKRLQLREFDTSCAASGELALERLAEATFDVVLLDVKMPGMSGIEALREIKRRHPEVEVIMLTGHASVDAAVEGMDEGAFDYLMKPVDLDDLVYKIEDARQSKVLRDRGPGIERRGG